MEELQDIISKRMYSYLTIALIIPGDLPKRLRRGSFQAQVLKDCGLPTTGVNRGLVNSIMSERGYRNVFIHGIRYYSKRT